MARYINADKLIENCEFFETEMEVKNAPTEDVVERNSVLEMLSKINNAVEDGDGFQYEEWIDYANDIPSYNSIKTELNGDLISRDYVLSKFKEQCDRCGKYKENNGVMCRCCALDDAIDYVEDAPSAEKTAEWKESEEEE